MLALVAVAAVVAAVTIYFIVQPSLSPTLATRATPVAGASSAPATPASNSDLMTAGPLGDRTLGDPKAPNVVIEYGALTCPHCQRFATEVFPEFKKKYIDTGKVYFIFREFPLNQVDQVAIMLARCVPADRYFAVVDLLYQRQNDWAFVDKPQDALRGLLKQVGLSQDSFDACLKDQNVLNGVNWVKNNATDKLGVEATPTFFINGKKVEGEQTLAEIDKILAG